MTDTEQEKEKYIKIEKTDDGINVKHIGFNKPKVLIDTLSVGVNDIVKHLIEDDFIKQNRIQRFVENLIEGMFEDI